jgi:DNA invertase Pin-like site-specific DNA recombinase
MRRGDHPRCRSLVAQQTDLLVIARDIQKVGAGFIRSLSPSSTPRPISQATLGVAANLERRCIKERTQRGRADAKAKGVKFDREPKPHQWREAIEGRDKDGEMLRAIASVATISSAEDNCHWARL